MRSTMPRSAWDCAGGVGMQIEVSQELMALHGDETAAMMAPPSPPGLR
jgi:hypothetical protein